MTNLIFGVTGQTGSYIAENLVKEGKKVIGVARRLSSPNIDRIAHLLDDITLIEGDITDPFSVSRTIEDYGPKYIYNMAAQSHVATSFGQPALTFQATAVGCLNILEAIRNIEPNGIHFLQASSSEMFGASYSSRVIKNKQHPLYDVPESELFKYSKLKCDVPYSTLEKYQDEGTPFLPQSPYAIAKVAAHYLVRNYRESYGMNCRSSICFNHETLSYGMPIIIKDNNNLIDILPIGDVARFHSGVIFDMSRMEYQEGKPVGDIKIWDQNGWVDIKWVSGYPHKNDKSPRIINARNYTYTATSSHPCIMEDDSEKETGDIVVGDRVKNISYPDVSNETVITEEIAEWLGMLVGDGNLNKGKPRFTNKNPDLRKRFFDLWSSFASNPSYKYTKTSSGFTGEEIGQITCYGDIDIDLDIYTNEINIFGHKTKKIPKIILNSSPQIMEAFLVGYNLCDGLKKNPCVYKFKNFKTNSATLASGLLFLISKTTGQKYNITVEESWKHGKQQFYYSINLLSDKITSMSKYHSVKELLDKGYTINQIHRDTGISCGFISKIKKGYVPSNKHYLELCSNEVKKIINIPNYNGWFFDFETSSGTFHAGVGCGVVHNSPRRGETFVTRKVTKWLGELYKWYNRHYVDLKNVTFSDDHIHSSDGLFSLPKLRLGNLNISRDWGHANDYARAMIIMNEMDTPKDYIICTGETHTLEEFLKLAFSYIGVNNYMDFIKIDPQFFRPSEVEYLKGDCSLIKSELGWAPKTSFEELVKQMVHADLTGE